MSKTSRLEQETIITFNQEEDAASLYTASPAVYRRMTKRGFKSETLDSYSWVFALPKNSIRLPSKPRVLTAKQKLEAGERLRTRLKSKSLSGQANL